jgi:hypothetical protein
MLLALAHRPWQKIAIIQNNGLFGVGLGRGLAWFCRTWATAEGSDALGPPVGPRPAFTAAWTGYVVGLCSVAHLEESVRGALGHFVLRPVQVSRNVPSVGMVVGGNGTNSSCSYVLCKAMLTAHKVKRIEGILGCWILPVRVDGLVAL